MPAKTSIKPVTANLASFITPGVRSIFRNRGISWLFNNLNRKVINETHSRTMPAAISRKLTNNIRSPLLKRCWAGRKADFVVAATSRIFASGYITNYIVCEALSEILRARQHILKGMVLDVSNIQAIPYPKLC